MVPMDEPVAEDITHTAKKVKLVNKLPLTPKESASQTKPEER